MGIGKTIGYIISVLGVAVVAIGAVDPLRLALKLTSIKPFILMLIGLVIAIIGMVPIMKSSGSKKVQEVPIYHGKDVVGFRRIGKK